MSGSLALQMYIDGEHVDARSGGRFDVLNPATGELYATVPEGGADIRAGGVWFNESPFGGMKASGFGRELSLHTLDAYTEVKNVGISLRTHIPRFELS
jgi:acyl-CoA reductase-like NAD-dependent aldehyde dehydrogenase